MKMLDLFCGAGGAAMGYHLAGFQEIRFQEIHGVDIKPQKHYPFTFHQGDALKYLVEHGREYDFIHASPPCQAYSVASNQMRIAGKEYPDLVKATIDLLERSGKVWIVENVPQAPMQGVTLCGTMFGLGVFRHRIFASNVFLLVPDHLPHKGHIGDGEFFQVCGWGGLGKGKGGRVDRGHISQWRKAMGISWMSAKEITQAIPPAYTKFLGRQILENWL